MLAPADLRDVPRAPQMTLGPALGWGGDHIVLLRPLVGLLHDLGLVLRLSRAHGHDMPGLAPAASRSPTNFSRGFQGRGVSGGQNPEMTRDP